MYGRICQRDLDIHAALVMASISNGFLYTIYPLYFSQMLPPFIQRFSLVFPQSF
jgi:hypothetical protein